MEKFKKVGKVLIPVTMALLPVLAFALTNPTPPLAGNPVTLGEIEDLIRRIAQFLIVIGVIIAVIFIIFGGLQYITAGGDDKKAEKGKTAVKNGVIGAAIILGVGVILQTVAVLVTRQFFD